MHDYSGHNHLLVYDYVLQHAHVGVVGDPGLVVPLCVVLLVVVARGQVEGLYLLLLPEVESVGTEFLLAWGHLRLKAHGRPKDKSVIVNVVDNLRYREKRVKKIQLCLWIII